MTVAITFPSQNDTGSHARITLQHGEIIQNDLKVYSSVASF